MKPRLSSLTQEVVGTTGRADADPDGLMPGERSRHAWSTEISWLQDPGRGRHRIFQRVNGVLRGYSWMMLSGSS